MGADTPGSFSAITAAKRAQFISYREAVEKLVAHSGESPRQVAEGLKHLDFDDCNVAVLSGVERRFEQIPDSSFVTALLDETIRTGVIPDRVGIWQEKDADPELDGWVRFDFINQLEECYPNGCPDTLNTSQANGANVRESVSRPLPEWAYAMRGMASLTLSEAANVLAGIDPHESSWGFDGDEAREFKRYRRVLTSAIDAEELQAGTWGADRDEQEISHSDLRHWCKRHGYTWLIPDISPIPSTDAEAVALIEELSRANADLSAQIEASETSPAKRLEVTLEGLRAERDAIATEAARLAESVPPHPKRLMQIAIAIQHRYWGENWSALDRDTWPPQANILEWLKSNHPSLSDFQRKAVEAVACPVDRARSSENQP